MSPRQYWIAMEAKGRERKHERQERDRHAWMTAKLHRAEKIPKLEDLISDRPRKTIEQSMEELRTRTAHLPTMTWEEFKRSRT